MEIIVEDKARDQIIDKGYSEVYITVQMETT